jgi:hypothetical protein
VQDLSRPTRVAVPAQTLSGVTPFLRERCAAARRRIAQNLCQCSVLAVADANSTISATGQCPTASPEELTFDS